MVIMVYILYPLSRTATELASDWNPAAALSVHISVNYNDG